MFSGRITLLGSGILMNDALATTYNYLTSEEGSCGVMTVIVLALGCLVMLTCMISYPEVSEAFAFGG
jgi:hypothetical protein